MGYIVCRNKHRQLVDGQLFGAKPLRPVSEAGRMSASLCLTFFSAHLTQYWVPGRISSRSLGIVLLQLRHLVFIVVPV